MADPDTTAVLVDGRRVSIETLPSGCDFETTYDAVQDLTIFSCVKALRESFSSNPEYPFAGLMESPNVELAIDLGSHKLPWEENLQAIYILARQELICEFHVLTAAQTAHEKYCEIARSADLNRGFRIKSILPVVGDKIGKRESAREWNLRIVCESEDARFSDLFRVRENISRASFPQHLDSDEYIDSCVPNLESLSPMPFLALPPATSPTVPVTVNINQQVISAVESTVIQSIQGTSNLGVQAKELLALVRRFGGPEVISLESAVHEFEDPNTRPAGSLNAKRRLMAFLAQLAGKIEDVAFMALEKYLETKLGK